MTRDTPIILLVLKDSRGHLRFLVHPEWLMIVTPEDADYIESLLGDFIERAKLHPEALFRQLSSLGVGPLVTHMVGREISEHPRLAELSRRFVEH